MTTLAPGTPGIALINTFTVEPVKTDELLQLLIQATEETMRHLPGFISANLHVSLDRKHVANYAQWRSNEDLTAMQKNPEAQRHMKRAGELALSFEPILYELLHVCDSAN